MLEKRRLVMLCVAMTIISSVLVMCGYHTGIYFAVMLGWCISFVMLMCIVSIVIDITRD